MTTIDLEPIRPFRWDVAGGANLGRLLQDAPAPNLWFADELIRVAALVLARSGDGDLRFVGRSMDSLYDLLSGALEVASDPDHLRALPFSMRFRGPAALSPGELRQGRVNLAAEGLAPERLARRRRSVVFVDLVSEGSTFENLFTMIRDWVVDDGAQWDVIRRKLRFIGITRRTHTSPNTWRWYQAADWTAELPRSAVSSVSIDHVVWGYLGNVQPKASRSFRSSRWLDESVQDPAREDEHIAGLAEAVALVELGRRRSTRAELVRIMAQEPTFAEPWLRSLAVAMRGGT